MKHNTERRIRAASNQLPRRDSDQPKRPTVSYEEVQTSGLFLRVLGMLTEEGRSRLQEIAATFDAHLSGLPIDTCERLIYVLWFGPDDNDWETYSAAVDQLDIEQVELVLCLFAKVRSAYGMPSDPSDNYLECSGFILTDETIGTDLA